MDATTKTIRNCREHSVCISLRWVYIYNPRRPGTANTLLTNIVTGPLLRTALRPASTPFLYGPMLMTARYTVPALSDAAQVCGGSHRKRDERSSYAEFVARRQRESVITGVLSRVMNTSRSTAHAYSSRHRGRMVYTYGNIVYLMSTDRIKRLRVPSSNSF